MITTIIESSEEAESELRYLRIYFSLRYRFSSAQISGSSVHPASRSVMKQADLWKCCLSSEVVKKSQTGADHAGARISASFFLFVSFFFFFFLWVVISLRSRGSEASLAPGGGRASLATLRRSVAVSTLVSNSAQKVKTPTNANERVCRQSGPSSFFLHRPVHTCFNLLTLSLQRIV